MHQDVSSIATRKPRALVWPVTQPFGVLLRHTALPGAHKYLPLNLLPSRLMSKVIFALVAFIELLEVPFHMPVKSASGSGESGAVAETAVAAEPDWAPPPPL